MLGPQSIRRRLRTAANPGWRKSAALVAVFKSNNTSADGLHWIAPEKETYINGTSMEQKHWTSVFLGDIYPRLSQFKTDLDSNMTSYESLGINADHMEAVHGRTCLFDPPPKNPSLIPPPTDKHVRPNLLVDGHFLFGE